MKLPKKAAKKPKAVKPDSLRTSDSTDEGFFLLSNTARSIRKSNIKTLREQPFGQCFAGDIFGPVASGTATAQQHKSAGEVVCHFLERRDLKAVKKLFREIERIKGQIDGQKLSNDHCNAIAYQAYSAYIEITGREPTKGELKDYILKNPERFKGGFPAKGEDEKGWTRVLAAAGLKGLKNSR